MSINHACVFSLTAHHNRDIIRNHWSYGFLVPISDCMLFNICLGIEHPYLTWIHRDLQFVYLLCNVFMQFWPFTKYTWLWLVINLKWDYTVYKWGYKWLMTGISGHNCGTSRFSSHCLTKGNTKPQSGLRRWDWCVQNARKEIYICHLSEHMVPLNQSVISFPTFYPRYNCSLKDMPYSPFSGRSILLSAWL